MNITNEYHFWSLAGSLNFALMIISIKGFTHSIDDVVKIYVTFVTFVVDLIHPVVEGIRSR